MVNNLSRHIIGRPSTLTKGQEHKYSSIFDRWRRDEVYRISQQATGCDETRCKYLDYLDKVDMSYNAAQHQRTRYLHQIVFKSGDPDLQAGPMAKREDSKQTVQVLFSVRKEQGRENTVIPKKSKK